MEVSGFIVGCAGLPATVHDALPFERQGTQGAVVSGSASSEHAIVSLGPQRFLSRVVGVLMESLVQELGTGQAAVHGARLAAASEHRGDATELLHVRGGGESLAVAADS